MRLLASKPSPSDDPFGEIERLRKQFGPGRWRKRKGIATVRLPSGRIHRAELHWYEAHGIGKRKVKIKRYFGLVRMNRDLKRRRRPQPRFVLCIKNKDCEDLEVRKIYRVLPDRAASQDDLLRIVDESGEDYLYPAAYFTAIELPSEIEKALLLAS